MPLESVTEYRARFPEHPLQFAGLRKPPAHVAASGVPLASVTESREQFGPKPIPARFQMPKREYQPTPAPLEGVTGYKEDFRAWEGARPRSSAKKPEMYKPSGDFDGVTTNKADFQAWDIPARYRHPKQVYVPNPASLEPSSSYATDYVAVAVQRPTPRPPERYHPVPEDRSFDTTMSANFVAAGPPLSRPTRYRAVAYVPPDTHLLVKESTSHTDYAGRAARPGEGRRAPCRPPAAIPEPRKFDGCSEYAVEFAGKPVGPPPKNRARPPAKWAPNPAPLDGVTTMKADFTGVTSPRRDHFGPRLQYVPVPDDRSWLTETKDAHSPKPLPPGAPARRLAVPPAAAGERNLIGHS